MLPLADSSQVKLARTALSGPDVHPATGLLIVPIQNIGSGPALRVRATVAPLDPSGKWAGGCGAGPPKVEVTGLGVSQTMTLEMQYGGAREVPTFEIFLAYDDVSGKRWHTYGRWNVIQGRYEDLVVDVRVDD